MRVVDAKGQILDLPDEQAWAGLRSGDYGLQPGQDVAVRSQQGTIGTVKAENIGTALTEGYQPIAEAELAHEEKRLRAESVGGVAGTIGAGVARGATLGLSDEVIAGLGGTEAQRALNEYREINPWLSTGSEIGGALIPAFFTGGSSGAATGAELAATGAREASLLSRGASALSRAAFAPARIQQGLGTLAEHGVAALLPEGGGLLARGARTILPDMARGVAEGALQGVGNTITEHALGNRDLTAEALIANIGHGAVMGGALGGSIGALRFGAGEARKGLAALLSRGATEAPLPNLGTAATDALSTRTRTAIGHEAEAMSAVGMRDSLTAEGGGGQMTAKVYHALHDTDGEVAAALRARETREIMLRNADREADRLAMSATKHYDAGARATEMVQEGVLRGTAKDAQIARLVDETRAPIAADRAQGILADVYALRDTIAMDPLAPKPLVSKVNALAEGYNTLLSRAMAADEGVAGKLFAELDNLKYDIGKLASNTGGKHGLVLEGFYNNSLKPLLEDSVVWSKAAESQRAINAPYSAWIGYKRAAIDRFEDSFGKKPTATSFDELMESDPATLKALFKQIGGAESVKRMELLDNLANAQKELANAAESSYALTPAQKKAVQTMRDSTDAYHGVVKEAQANMSLIRKAEETEAKAASPLSKAVGKIPGAGPLLELAFSTNPVSIARHTESVMALGQRIKTLVGIDSVARATTTRVAEAAKQMVMPKLPKLSSGGGTGGAPHASAVSFAVKTIGSTPEDRQKGYEAKRKELEAIVNDPRRAKAAASHIAGDAPGVADAVARSLQAQAQYLLAMAPKGPPVSALQPDVTMPPSDAQILSWLQRLSAVDHPDAALRDISAGVAPAETIDAFRETNPALYGHLRTTVIEYVSQQTGPLSADAERRVASVLGIQPDPGRTQAYQQTYAAAHEPPKPRPMPQGKTTDRLTSAADRIERGDE